MYKSNLTIFVLIIMIFLLNLSCDMSDNNSNSNSNNAVNSENNTANSSSQNNTDANDDGNISNQTNNDDNSNNVNNNNGNNNDNDDDNIANNDANDDNGNNSNNEVNNDNTNNNNEDICNNTAALREEALTSGTTHYNGVAELSESTSLAELNSDNAHLYENRLVQVEGIAIHICAGSGVRTMLSDYEGNQINVEGTAGTIDLRETLMIGQYVVAEGIFSSAGGHGAQLRMEEYGAMSSATACPPPMEYEEPNNEHNAEHNIENNNTELTELFNSNERHVTDGLSPDNGEEGFFCGVRLTPESYPFTIKKISYPVNNGSQANTNTVCDATLEHIVEVYISSEETPPSEPEVAASITVPSVSADTIPVEPPTRFVEIELENEIIIEEGKHIFVAVKLVGTYPNVLCIGVDQDNGYSANRNYWSSAASAPYSWVQLDSFGLLGNIILSVFGN